MKRKKKSLRPETWHLDLGDDFWFKAFEEDSKPENKDPEMEKLLQEYQKLPKPKKVG